MALLISQITNNILVQRYAENAARKSSFEISKIYSKIRGLIDDYCPAILLNSYDMKNRRRIVKLSGRIKKLLETSVEKAEKSLIDDIELIVDEQIDFQKKSYNLLTEGDLLLTGYPKTKSIRETLSAPFMAGATIHQAMSAIPKARHDIIKKELAKSVHYNIPLDEVRKNIIGTKIKNSGIIGTAKRNVETIARTSINQSVNAVKKNMALDNGVEEYLYFAILDGRTSAICASFAGLRFRFDDPEAPIPPLHPNCRSTIVYQTPGVRNKILDKDFTYDNWLSKKSFALQKKILGETKAKLFRDGGFSVKDFVSEDFSPISVAELRRTNEEAFDRLGL